MLALLRDCTSESTNPRPHFQALQYRFCAHLLFVTFLFLFIQIIKYISTINITLLSLSLRRTCAPIQFAIVLGVLGDTRDFLYLIAGVVSERPSSSYVSHGLINLKSFT